MGPTVASITMSWNIWLPFYISLGLLACAIPAIALLPDTHKSTVIETDAAHLQHSPGADVEEAGPLLGTESEHGRGHYVSAFEKPEGFAQETVFAARKLMSLVRGRRNFQVLLCSFFLTALASSDTKLLVQYISKRYEWTFAEVSDVLAVSIGTSVNDRLGWFHVVSKSYRQLHITRNRSATPHPQVDGHRSSVWL